MKDYIKNKLKRIQKYSVLGHGGHGGRSKDEQRAAAEARANRIQANADRVAETFSQLSPPFGADLLLGTAKLESIELLSDGPIKGFFDQDGKETNVLGATYINDIPIVAKTEKRVRHKDLKLDHCKGCQLDYTTGVKRYLMDFRAYLSTGIGFTGRKHGFDETNTYTDGINVMAPAEMIFPATQYTLDVQRKDNLGYALGEEARKRSIQFAYNPGIDSNGNITSSFPKRKSNANEFKNNPTDYYNQGYRQSPYGQLSFYGQDQISSRSDFFIPSTNSYTNDRPLKYQGSAIAGGGLDPLNGKVQSSFITRAFYNVLQGFFDIAPNEDIEKFRTGYAFPVISDFYTSFHAQEFGQTTGAFAGRHRGQNGNMPPLVEGDPPYITRHFNFHPGSQEPDGLIEPHISGIYNLLAELPNQKEIKGNIFKQSHEHAYRAFGVECTGFMHESLTLGGQTNRSVLEFRGLEPYIRQSDGKEFHQLDLDSNSVNFGTYIFLGNENREGIWNLLLGGNVFTGQRHNAGYLEQSFTKEMPLLSFTSGEKVRFTGSYYIPAGGKVSGLLFQSIDDTGRKILDARSTMDQWVDFDFTNQDADVSGGMSSNNGVYVMRMADFNNDSENLTNWTFGGNGCMRPNDGFFMKNLTITRSDVIDTLPGFKGNNTGYLIFPADSHTFATNGDEDSKIKPNYNLSFSFGSGDAVSLGGETLKYVLSDVDGFSGIERSIRESIALEVDLEGEDRNDRTSKLYNITGTSSAHNHVVGLEENRPTRLKGAILYPVYLGEEGTALSGVNDTHRLESLSRVMIFPNDDHEVKQLKYQSGVQYNYDVFSGMENGGICYSHIANPNIITTVNLYDAGLGGNIRPTGHGYPIQIRLEEKEPTSFNFPNVYVASRDGQEVQSPLVTMSRTEVPIGIDLLGPYAYESHSLNSDISNYNATLKINTGLANMGPGGSLRRSAFDIFDASPYLDQTSPKFSTGFLSIPSLSSADIEFDRNIDFNNWNEKPFTAADEVAAVHQITRSEVDSISVVFQISALSSEHIFEDDPDSPRVGRDKASLHLEVEVGFQGVDNSVLPPQRTDITYEGITKNVYTVQTKDIILPTYDELLETSNESIENLKAKFKRYVKVRKLDYETLSTRIERQISCYSIIESVDCKFTYPFSALVQTELDARNFMEIPNRTFNTKLRTDGTDKRFIKNADSYQGDAKIYDGDWDGSFKFNWTDNPAWILYDLLTSNRYGIGNFIDDTEDINIFNLYKIARYCDAVNNDGYFVGIPDGIGGLEPRYSANILINQSDAAFEIINQITAIFNGNAFWANGVLDFYSDRPAKPAAFFNNGNVFDGHFTYQDVSKSSNFNCVSVQFQDKNDDFKIKTEIVEDEDGIRKDGKLVRELNGRGTTSRGQARRLAKYVLYSNKLEREIVYFKAGLEALMVNVGDIIEISDELKQFKIDGARVLQVNPNDPSIVIENTIDINSIDNEAFIYAPSGQTGKAEMYDEIRKGGLITNERLSGMDAQQVDKLQISSAVAEGDNGIKLNFTNVSGQSMSLIRTGSFANINLTNNESQTFRVIRIVPDDEQDVYSVMATEYNSGKFNFIEGNDENFNLSETTPFNIGIPNHTIQELTEPNSFSFTQTQNHIGTFDLNFTINGELSGNEEVYLISVVYPNGIRKEKRVKKSSETSGGYFVTETSFRNLEVFGTYNVFVKSDS
jgi:hypothetical protein